MIGRHKAQSRSEVRRKLKGVQPASDGVFGNATIEAFDSFVQSEARSDGNFKIDLEDITFKHRQEREGKRKTAHGHALEAGRRDQYKKTNAFYAKNTPAMLETCFVSNKSAQRMHQLTLDTAEQNESDRKRRKWVRASGRVPVSRIGLDQYKGAAKSEQQQHRAHAKLGVQDGSFIVQSEDGARIDFVPMDDKFRDEETGKKDWDAVPKGAIGIATDPIGWLAVSLMIMHREDALNLDISKPDAALAAEDPDLEGCAGKIDGAFLTEWGDGAPGTGSTPWLGNRGRWVNDPSQKLLPRGRGIPIPTALWAGKEELGVQQLEADMTPLATDGDGYTKINFPEYKTYILIKLPLRMIAGDHKMLCTYLGQLGGSADCRLHFLQPLPIGMSEDIEQFVGSNLWDMTQLRLDTLSAVAIGLATMLQQPVVNTTYYTVDRLKEELEHTHSIPKKRLNKKGVLRDELCDMLADAQGERTWEDIGDAIESGVLDRNTVRSFYTQWRHRTGSDRFPVCVPRNRKAFEAMLEMTTDILRELHDAHVTSKPPTPDSTRSFLRLLLSLDDFVTEKVTKDAQKKDVIHPSQFSYNARSVTAHVEAWLRGDRVDGDDASFDIASVICGIGFDHNRKARAKLFKELVLSVGLPMFRPGKSTEAHAEQRQRMLDQMGVRAGFADYVHGRHWDRLFHDIASTFSTMHEMVQALGYCIARSNLHAKRPPRALSEQLAEPELRCQMCVKQSGEVSLTASDIFATDAVEIALQHGLELSVCLLFRAMAKQSDINLTTYTISQRRLPYLASEYRQQGEGACQFFYSDFLGESMQKNPRRYLQERCLPTTVRTLLRAQGNQMTKWELRVSGMSKPERNHNSRDENPAMNTLILSRDCVLEILAKRNEKRDPNSGAFVRTTTVAARSSASSKDAESESDADDSGSESDSDGSSSDESESDGEEIDAGDDAAGEEEADEEEVEYPCDDAVFKGSKRLRDTEVVEGERNGKRLAVSLREQTEQNIAAAIADIQQKLGKQYVAETGGCVVFGFGAIAIYLLEEVWDRTERDCGLEHVVAESPWTLREGSPLRPGSYCISVFQADDAPHKTLHLRIGADRECTAELLAPVSSSTVSVQHWAVECFGVHMPSPELWSELTRCSEEEELGGQQLVKLLSRLGLGGCDALPRVVCGCAYRAADGCPFCPVDIRGMPADVDRDPLRRDGQAWTEDTQPLAAETVRGIVATGVARAVARASKPEEVEAQCVEPAAVRKVAETHLGETWTKEYVPEGDVFEKLALSELRFCAGKQPKSTAKNKSRLLGEAWKRLRGKKQEQMADGLSADAPRHFRGERCFFKFLNAAQQIDKNLEEAKEWYPGRVLGKGDELEGQPPTHHVIFDDDGYEHRRTTAYIQQPNKRFKPAMRAASGPITYDGEM
eukprot:COSAG04_NODE_1849_length_5405_cov_8.122638_2_plen_1409_part_00